MAKRLKQDLRIWRAEEGDDDYGVPDIHDGLIAELISGVDRKIVGSYSVGQNELGGGGADNQVLLDWSPVGTFKKGIFHNRDTEYNVVIRYDSMLGGFTEYQIITPGDVCILTTQYAGGGASKVFRMSGGAVGAILSEVDVWIFGT